MLHLPWPSPQTQGTRPLVMAHRGSDPLQGAVLTPTGVCGPWGKSSCPSSLWAPHSPGLALRPPQELFVAVVPARLSALCHELLVLTSENAVPQAPSPRGTPPPGTPPPGRAQLRQDPAVICLLKLPFPLDTELVRAFQQAISNRVVMGFGKWCHN